MDIKLFTEWFESQFVHIVTEYLTKINIPVKALISKDNENIRIIFFPPNVTSLIQPIDQGVLESLKKRYRSLLMDYLVACDDSVCDLTRKLKQITILDAFYWVKTSWDQMSISTI